MATYGVYSKDLKRCYIAGLDMIDARRYLAENRVLCEERKVPTELMVSFLIRKEWYWDINPRCGVLEMGYVGIRWTRLAKTEPYKVMPD